MLDSILIGFLKIDLWCLFFLINMYYIIKKILWLDKFVMKFRIGE